jgi:hypothetical protein
LTTDIQNIIKFQAVLFFDDRLELSKVFNGSEAFGAAITTRKNKRQSQMPLPSEIDGWEILIHFFFVNF